MANNKNNEQHLSGNGETDEEAINIKWTGHRTKRQEIRTCKETQLPPAGHSRHFILIVVSQTYLKVRTYHVYNPRLYSIASSRRRQRGFISATDRAIAQHRGHM